MDHLFPIGNVAGDLVFDGVPVRPIVSGDDLLSLQTRKPTRDLGKEVAVTHRPVQVDQQAGRHRGVERRGECLGDLPSQLECAGIPTAVAFQQSLVTGKEGRVGRRHFASAVLTADHEATTLVHRFTVNRRMSNTAQQFCLLGGELLVTEDALGPEVGKSFNHREDILFSTGRCRRLRCTTRLLCACRSRR